LDVTVFVEVIVCGDPGFVIVSVFVVPGRVMVFPGPADVTVSVFVTVEG
jgi:hypothetical protein